MSRPVTEQYTETYTLASFIDASCYSSSSTNEPIGKDISNTTYAQINLSRNANAVTVAQWGFDCSSIPSGATINSVSCSCKCSINQTNSNRITTRQAQLYSGSTAMGSAYTVANSTTAFSISAGTWTRAQLQDARLRLYAVRGSSNTTSSYYFRLYGCVLTVNYTISGTEYEVSFSNTSETVTSDPSTTQYIFQDESQEIKFYGITDPELVVVKDNGTEVTLEAVSTGTLSAIPSALVDSSGSITNSSYGLTDTASTTYAETYGQSQYYMVYGFDVSSIPLDATIVSVSCLAKAEHTHGSTVYGSMQLYSGSTAKGTASTFRAVETVTLDAGTWTRSELSDIRIKIGNTYTGGTTTYKTRFYGAELTVAYATASGIPSYYVYTITGISADHSIQISDAITYPVTIIDNNQYVTDVNPIGTISVRENTNCLITFKSASGTLGTNIFVTDNSVNKTSDVSYIAGGNLSDTIIANSYSDGTTGTNFTVSTTTNPITNAYRNSSNTSGYAALTLPTTANITCEIFFEFDTSFLNDIPLNASNITVTGQIRERVGNATYVSSIRKQLYSGTTAMGTAETTKSTATEVRTVSGGTWTRNQLENIRFCVSATRGTSTSSTNVRVYGLDVTVSYSVEGHYEYLILNVTGAHTVNIAESLTLQKLYKKINGVYVALSKVYKKINNSWVEQTDLESIFEYDKIYINKQS